MDILLVYKFIWGNQRIPIKFPQDTNAPKFLRRKERNLNPKMRRKRHVMTRTIHDWPDEGLSENR
jgi:hypothetical protein